VITGAGSGIDRSLSQRLAAEGATIAACDVDDRGVKETVARLEGTASHSPWLVDVADRGAMAKFADDVVAEYGRVDIVINNAGVLGQVAPLGELGYEELERIVAIDLWGVIHGVSGREGSCRSSLPGPTRHQP
jgi:NAD(P)-dependent dehydrogenase (short-subunit alcohol dehydrogenase family)